MRLVTLASSVVFLAFLGPTVAHPQAKPAETAPTHLKLVFRLLQLNANGKIINSRTYSSLITAEGDHPPFAEAQIRSGDRVPYANEGGKFDYEDVGTNIDADQAFVRDDRLTMHVSAQASSVVKVSEGQSQPTHFLLPFIRRTSWGANVSVPFDKPTIIFASDNPSDTGKTELELTATEIK
jgi:hypothetical protein